MAEKLSSIEHLLNCPVCGETFTEPASLTCKHSFCSGCLQNYWEESQSKSCPVCNRRSSKGIDVNFALKQLADSFAGRQSEPCEEPGSSAIGKEVKMELVCGVHNEKKMFCENDQEALCALCEFPLHKDHTLVPVEEAVSGLKEKLQFDLTALKDKKEKCGQVEEKYKNVLQQSKNQASFIERQIRREFNERRRLQDEEEERRVEALREDEEQKTETVVREMRKAQQQMWYLSSSIAAVEEELQKNPAAFLNSYKASQSRARAQCSKPDPQLVPGELIDLNEHLENLSLTTGQGLGLGYSPFTQYPSVGSSSTQSSHYTNPFTPFPGPKFEILRSRCFPDNPEFLSASEDSTSSLDIKMPEVGDNPECTESEAKNPVDTESELTRFPTALHKDDVDE